MLLGSQPRRAARTNQARIARQGSQVTAARASRDNAGAARATGWALRRATATDNWTALLNLIFARAARAPSRGAFLTWFAAAADSERGGRFSAPSDADLAEAVLAFTEATLTPADARRLRMAWGMRQSATAAARADSMAEANRTAAADARHWNERDRGIVPRSERQLAESVSGAWPPPRLADLDLVHWFRFASEFSGDQPTLYVERTADALLDERLRAALATYQVDSITGMLPSSGSGGSRQQVRHDWRTRIVVVAGPPKSGKTRSVLEALIRHGLAQSRVLVVRPPTGHGSGPEIQPLVRLASAQMSSVGVLDLRDRPLVVLVDDLHVHLRRGVNWTEAAPAIVDRPGCVVLVAILHDDVLHLSAETAVGLGLVEPELRSLAAAAVCYPSTLDSEESTRAAATYEEDIAVGSVVARELRHLAEYCASVPALTRRAESALAGSRPSAAALLRAALDWTVLRPEGFTRDQLRPTADLWYRSLAPTCGQLSDLDFEEGMSWITTALGSYYAILNPSQHDVAIWTVMDAVSSRLLLGHIPHPSHAGTASAPQLFLIGSHLQHRLNQIEPARPWYERAAQLGAAGAMNNLGWIAEREGDLAAAERCYEAAARGADQNAMRNLGLLARRRGDEVVAEAWFRRAAEGGQALAMAELAGRAKRSGEDSEARHWLTRAADAGDVEALHQLGDLLWNADDQSGGVERWQQAALAGSVPSMRHLGEAAVQAGDRDKGRKWLTRAATVTGGGDAKAMLALAKLVRGDGDAASELLWLERAAQAGSAEAMRRLGLVHYEAGDAASADSWWRVAAGAGNRGAMRNLAAMADERNDRDGARSWLVRAVDGADDPDLELLRILGYRDRDAGRFDEARAWLLLAAERGDVPSMAALGRLYNDEGNSAASRRWLRGAADGGSVHAMWNLAAVARHEGNVDVAVAWLDKAAELDAALPAELVCEVGVLMEDAGDPEGAQALYERAAEGGSKQALWELGNLAYTRGDLDQAYVRWLKAAEAGHVQGMRNLGELARQRRDLATARSWLEQAASHGDALAMEDLAVMDRNAGNLNEARSWFLQSAEAGHVPAMLGLLRNLEESGDFEGAQMWYERAADADGQSADFMHQMGDFCARHGDHAAAKDWWHRAAASGHAASMRHLGQLAAVAGDLASGRHWLTQAAAGDDHQAMSDLGSLANSVGDVSAARQWFERAAAGGLGSAMRSCAILIRNAGDLDGARRWAEQGASAGDAGSMIVLRDLARDRGDDTEAGSWLERAAAAGHAAAANEFAVGLLNAGDRGGATPWFERAAEAGHVQAMRIAGALRIEAGDEASGRALLVRAADSGDEVAMLQLGLLDLPVDLERARAWLQGAGTAGNGLALYLLGEIAGEVGDPNVDGYYKAAESAGFDPTAVNELL